MNRVILSPARTDSTLVFKYLRWLALLGILLLAAYLRLCQLDVTPPGLHYDEAFNANQARDVLSGTNRPVFFTGNFGEEPMQMYVEAAVFALAGQSPWSARLSNVILGLLLVPALYFCARAFFPTRSLIGLAAAFIGGTLFWAINFSRIGIESNSLPWVLTLSAGALAAASSSRNWRWGVFAGVFLGATLYTYLASRAWPIVVLLWVVYLFVLHRKQLSGRFSTWLVIAAVALLVLAPLGVFFLTNPLAVTGRSGQVLSLDQLGTNVARTAGMFFFSGDTDPRDNLPGRPALDPFLAALFLIGLAVTLARANKTTYAFLSIWLVVMTLPSVLTDFAPNFRRAIGALPSVALVCGVGADWLWSLTQKQVSRGDVPPVGRFGAWGSWPSTLSARGVVCTILVLGFAFSAYSSARDYFTAWAPSSGLYYSFDAGLLKLAQVLAARPAGEQLCISPDYHEHPTVLWAMDGRAFSSFDGRRVAVLPNSALPATCAIITYEDQTFSFLQFFPSAQRLATLYDFDARPYAEVFHIPAGANPNIYPQHKTDARVGDAVRVLGYDLTRDGDRIDLRVYWLAEGTIQEDYTVFVHLLSPLNSANGSTILAQDDSQPGRGTYPTSRWREGETIIDQYALQMPTVGAQQGYQVEIGMYLLSTGVRLPVWINGGRAGDDRMLIGEIPNK